MAKGAGSTRSSRSSSPRGLSAPTGKGDAISRVTQILKTDISRWSASAKADLQSEIANQAMRDIDAIREKAEKDRETLRAVLSSDTDYLFKSMEISDKANKKVIELKEKQAQYLEKLSKHLWK